MTVRLGCPRPAETHGTTHSPARAVGWHASQNEAAESTNSRGLFSTDQQSERQAYNPGVIERRRMAPRFGLGRWPGVPLTSVQR